MGSCASLRRNPERSAVKMRPPGGSVADEPQIPPSPIKHCNTLSPISHKPPSASFLTLSSLAHGSREEAFFDSRARFDSDSEDFFSVRGDFTPSCGNTPRISRVCNEDRVSGSSPLPLPVKRRKKLAELFRESLGGDADFGFLKKEESYLTLTAGAGGSEKQPTGSKLICCLAPLVSCHSWSQRKTNLNLSAIDVS